MPQCSHHPTHNTFLCARTYIFFILYFFHLMRLASMTALCQKDDHFILYQLIIYFNVLDTICASICLYPSHYTSLCVRTYNFPKYSTYCFFFWTSFTYFPSEAFFLSSCFLLSAKTLVFAMLLNPGHPSAEH